MYNYRWPSFSLGLADRLILIQFNWTFKGDFSGTKIHSQDSCRRSKGQKKMLKLLRTPCIRCMRRVCDVHICGGCAQDHAEQSRTERNRRRNGTHGAEKRELTAARGAACLLAHLSVLNLYVVSATGSAPTIPPPPPPVPSAGLAASERDGEAEKGTGSGKGREGANGSEEERRSPGQGEIYLPRESCGREIESRESDKPTTVGAHPPHYAHRSRDFNVPGETAACRSSRGGKMGPRPDAKRGINDNNLFMTYS